MTTSYRPDIDGLRAISILLVVLFHSKVSVLSGGFVGVDVFFVISGYLITSIVRSELARGTFSIATFYKRRIREFSQHCSSFLPFPRLRLFGSWSHFCSGFLGKT